MQGISLSRRARAKVAREVKRAELELRRRRVSGDLFVDYGWIRLLYSGDSDGQELAYHLNQAHWYEKDLHVFRSLLAPGQTAIDVGANLGVLTTLLASIVGPAGRVLSFEPSPVVFEKLMKMISANDLSQVVPLNCGCGATASVATLNMVSDSTGNASIVGSGRYGVEIQLRRLDDVPEVWDTPVPPLKIDTEGYEPEVLEGARKLTDAHKPIIYLEMGGDYVDSTRRSIEFLSEAGYGTDHVQHVDRSQVASRSEYFIFLAARRERGCSHRAWFAPKIRIRAREGKVHAPSSCVAGGDLLRSSAGAGAYAAARLLARPGRTRREAGEPCFRARARPGTGRGTS